MIIGIDTDKIEDANVFGELLREYCFDDTPCMTMTGFHKPYGCYSSFELKNGFSRIYGNEGRMSEYIFNYFADIAKWRHSEQDRTFFLYQKGNIYIGWWWDGDGTLIIQCGRKTVINNDCKCDDIWEWVE